MKFNTETLYTIETNNGVIGFDLLDTSNMSRVEAMYDDFKKAEAVFKGEEHAINKKNDQSLDSYGNKKGERELLRSLNKFTNSCAKTLDKFFGDGASDKIFYEPILGRVIINQYKLNQLINELLPKEFEKAGLKVYDIVKERSNKENREKFVTKDTEVKKLD